MRYVVIYSNSTAPPYTCENGEAAVEGPTTVLTTMTQITTPSSIEYVLPTGIEVLDEHLDGGLQPGGIVALIASPVSQSELILAKFSNERETLYLTLQRTPEAVRRTLSRSGANMDNVAVRLVDHDRLLDDSYLLISEITSPANVIIDPTNVIESEADHRLWAFLNAAQSHLTDVGGLLILHCLTGETKSPGRVTTEHMADVVFQLETDYLGDTVENRLLVPKIRGGRALPQVIKLELTNDVAIDTSRDIA